MIFLGYSFLTPIAFFQEGNFTMAQANIAFQKVTALPDAGTRTPNTMYMVQAANGLMEVHMTGLSAADVRHTPVESEIKGWIASELSGFNNVLLAATLSARDAMIPTFTQNVLVMVADATDDTTVTAGAAMYMFDFNTSSFTKIYEAESLDVVLTWENIQGRPTSDVASIDDAVSKRHSHANATVLDGLSADVDGNLMYNNSYVSARLTEASW